MRQIKILSMALLLILGGCGGTADTSMTSVAIPPPALMVLPSELSAVSSSLTATLTVYSSTVTQIFHKTLGFDVDSDGNDIVLSPTLSLKQNNHYRFVVVFYWNKVVYAYVDQVLQISENSTTSLEYEASDIEYDTTDPTSSLSVPMVYAKGAANLNISDFTAEQSGTALLLDATIDNAVDDLVVSVVFSEGDNAFLTLDVSDRLTLSNDKQYLSTAIDTLAFPTDAVQMKLVVGDGSGVVSSLTTEIEIMDLE